MILAKRIKGYTLSSNAILEYRNCRKKWILLKQILNNKKFFQAIIKMKPRNPMKGSSQKIRSWNDKKMKSCKQ